MGLLDALLNRGNSQPQESAPTCPAPDMSAGPGAPVPPPGQPGQPATMPPPGTAPPMDDGDVAPDDTAPAGDGACGKKGLPIPKYGDSFLTPMVRAPPSENAKKLLRQVSDSTIKADKTFSVTNSPICCPVSPNYLFALRPYIWETKPGCWERRDGRRNPFCDKPSGQKELNNMALAVQALAFGSVANANADYAVYAQKLLYTFFIDEKTKMMPEVSYAQCNPGENPLKGDKMFVVAALRVLNMGPELEAGMRAWCQAQVDWMETSEQGVEARSAGNNITLWYYALLTSHKGYLDPANSAQFATSIVSNIMREGAEPQTLFAPELARTRPRHYVLFTLEALMCICGETCVPTAGGWEAPPAEVMTWLQSLVAFAKTVPPSALEAERDNDLRYGSQLAWFDRMMQRWTTGTVPDVEPDGSQYEAGYNQQARLAWSLI